MTALKNMDERAPMVTSPMTQASGAINTSDAMVGEDD
jgi:hypothetical protein